MRRFIFIILLIGIVGCGSGSSSSGGGNNPVSSTGDSGLSVSGSATVTSISVDTVASTVAQCPNLSAAQLLTTHTGTASITVSDIHSQYTNLKQGVTFTSYAVSYSGGSVSIPSVTYNQTMQIPLSGGTSASGSFTVNIFDLTTKSAFASAWSGTPNPINYTATIVFRGKDWITNSDITLTVNVAIEVGNFC